MSLCSKIVGAAGLHGDQFILESKENREKYKDAENPQKGAKKGGRESIETWQLRADPRDGKSTRREHQAIGT